MTDRILIAGATSAIAQEIARNFALEGCEIILAGRNNEKLQAVAQDLRSRGSPRSEVIAFDAADASSARSLFSRAEATLGPVSHLVIAHGVLGSAPDLSPQTEAEAATLFQVNTLSAITLGFESARVFAERKSGSITFVSSVAGERGRKSILLYGPTKAALTSFASGLRNYLSATGVHVLTVLPGVVRTPMTAHLKHGPLTAEAATVGRDIHRAIRARRNYLYTPRRWQLIMTIIKTIPECLFKRLSL